MQRVNPENLQVPVQTKESRQKEEAAPRRRVRTCRCSNVRFFKCQCLRLSSMETAESLRRAYGRGCVRHLLAARAWPKREAPWDVTCSGLTVRS
jgi:hypothetical protein